MKINIYVFKIRKVNDVDFNDLTMHRIPCGKCSIVAVTLKLIEDGEVAPGELK